MSNRLKLLREKATRPRRTVALLLDGEVRGQIEAVEDELDRLDDNPDGLLNSRTGKRRKELEMELASLRAQAEQATLYVVVEGLQRSNYRALLAQHPPRKDEDGKIVRADVLGANSDTFQVPLARACIVGYQDSPDAAAPVEPIDAETVDWLLGTEDTEPFLTDRQIEVLASAALTVCRGDEAVPLPRTRSANQPSADA